MSDRVYKLLTGLCVGLMIAGCAGIGVSLNNMYAKRQIEASKLAAKRQLEMVYDSTVMLMVMNDNKETSTGTGFVVKTDNEGSWIVTNKHVCINAKTPPEIVRNNGGLFIFYPVMTIPRRGKGESSTIVRVAQNTDLCLVRTPIKFKDSLKLADKVDKESKIFSFGFPNSVAELNYGTYTGTKKEPYGYYGVTDMKIWFGASGSPVIDFNGKVVGVMAEIDYELPSGEKLDRKYVTQSLFIPLEILREFLGGI
jgi:S1-C subfamily serine protease